MLCLQKIILYIKYKIIYEIRALFYLGKNKICPCCNGHFRKFLPFGINKRSQAMCPGCGSLERQRFAWLFLKENIFPKYPRPKILHIGPEYAIQNKLSIMKEVDYISIDLNSPLAMKKMNLMDLTFKNEDFDIVLCIHVLEHVIDDKKALREIFRVLKYGGCMINQSPINHKLPTTFEDISIISPQERENNFWQKDHLRLYGRDYKNLLENYGFIVKTQNPLHFFNKVVIKKHGLFPNDELYICLKKAGTHTKLFNN